MKESEEIKGGREGGRERAKKAERGKKGERGK